MSKRRISKQQSARIQKIQARYRQKNDLSDTFPGEEGLVLTRFSRHAIIEDRQGNCIHCSIRPNLDSLVAGDQVIWQTESKGGVVVSRFPRVSVLSRPDKRGEFKPIAANITQVLVVVAPKPELTWPLLDSYLVMTEHLGLNLCIVLNKVDIPCVSLQEELLKLYKPLGYPILFTSSHNNSGYDLLRQTLNHHTSVFVGQSGVGKSSLISKILPEMNIQTAEISTGSELGCHTTSNSRLYHLPFGGNLIDSPGVREFGLWHMAIPEIAQGYREFRPLISQCKFRNCNHRDSPGCAIIAALDEGTLAQRRYDNFLKIIAQFA